MWYCAAKLGVDRSCSILGLEIDISAVETAIPFGCINPSAKCRFIKGCQRWISTAVVIGDDSVVTATERRADDAFWFKLILPSATSGGELDVKAVTLNLADNHGKKSVRKSNTTIRRWKIYTPFLSSPNPHPQSSGAQSWAPAWPHTPFQHREICSPDHDSLCPVVGGDVAKHEASYVIREPTDHEGNHHRTCKAWKKPINFCEKLFLEGEKGPVCVGVYHCKLLS